MNRFFETLKGFFTAKEWFILSISTILSAIILSSTLWIPPVQQGENPYQLLAYNTDVRDRTGERLDPFYTDLFFSNYEAKASDEEKQQVSSILEEEVQRLHRYGDRHHEFLTNPNNPNSAIVHNLKVLNAVHGQQQWLMIDATFYDLLSEAKTMTKFTEGAFNMFIGTVSDFWDDLLDNRLYRIQYTQLDPAYNPLQRRELESRMQYVPLAHHDVDQVLELKIENGQHFVRFNTFRQSPAGSIKITLGGIAKGFANDIMADRLSSQAFTRGYIYNGRSSITTLGPRYGNVPYQWQVISPHPSVKFAFTIEKPGRHSLSTSGAYEGFRMPLGSKRVLRHHIIDPRTGYPSKQAIELNVISSSYPAGRLDALSTAMMTIDTAKAMQYRDDIIRAGHDLEIAWIEVIDDQVHVTYSPGYEAILTRQRGVIYRRWSPNM
jgi:thiamine biosynthesis lipoprotein ApbE